MHAKRRFPGGCLTRAVPGRRTFGWGVVLALLCAWVPSALALTAEETAELQKIAQQIHRIEIRPVKFAEATYGEAQGYRTDLALVAKNRSGDKIPLTADQANALFEGQVHNPLSSNVAQIGSDGFLPGTFKGESVNSMTINYGTGRGAARLEVAVRPEYQAYVTAAPAKYMLVAKAPFWAKAGNLVKTHPYLSLAAAGTAIGGTVAIAESGGGGGGGGGGDGGGSDGGALVGTISGTWSGGGSYVGSLGGNFTMRFSAGGSVSGSYGGDYSGSIGGSLSGSGQLNASAGGSASGAEWSGRIWRNGSKLYGNGSWDGGMASGTWSGSGSAD